MTQLDHKPVTNTRFYCKPGTPSFLCSKTCLNILSAPGMFLSHHMRRGISLSRNRGAKVSGLALGVPISLGAHSEAQKHTHVHVIVGAL